MVGVPKRPGARGCEACKKRRLRCDLGRPTCARCKQHDRDCRFPSAFTFVVNDPGSHRTVYSKPSPDGIGRGVQTHRLESTRVQLATPPMISAIVEPQRSPAETEGLELVNQPPLSNVIDDASFMVAKSNSIPKQVSNIDLLQQQLFAHALHRFSTPSSKDIYLTRIWIPAIQHFATSSAPLKASPLACCAAWLARNDSNPAMVDFSRHLYSQGLQEVRTALCAPNAVLEDETLGACLSLAVFEVFECPGQTRSAYEWHRRACVNLLHMRGPHAHKDGVGHELFLAVRLHGIFFAFEQKRPNFLCTREWSTVPWQIHPKDDFHRIADILSRGPELLYEAEDIPNKPLEQSLPTLFTILSRLLDIDSDIECLYAEMEAKSGPLVWEADATGVFFANDEEPEASTRFEFPDIKTASLLTLYWSIQTMVWSALENIHSGLVQTHTLQLLPGSPRTSRFNALAPGRFWLRMVRNVIRSIDFCMTSMVNAASPPGIGIALEIVIDVMKQKTGCEREMRRAVGAREEMGKKWVAILLS